MTEIQAAKELAENQKKSTLMDTISAIPMFSGEQGTVSCGEFFEKLDRFSNYLKWGEDDKRFVILSRLSGTALRWVKPHKEKPILELEQAIRDRFVQKDTPDVAMTRFTTFKQAAGMPVQEFYDRISELASQALVVDGMDRAVAAKSRNAMLHCIMLSNLAPEIRKGVITKDPQTPEEILKFALLEEKALKSTNPFFSLNNDFVFGTTQQQTPMACAATYPVRQQSNKEVEELREKLDLLSAKLDSLIDSKGAEATRKSSNATGGFVCYHCGQPNHYARDCLQRTQESYSQNRNYRGNFSNRGRGRNFRGNSNSSQRSDYGNAGSYQDSNNSGQRGGYNSNRGGGNSRNNHSRGNNFNQGVNSVNNVMPQQNNETGDQNLN